jgi:hypothetical protein
MSENTWLSPKTSNLTSAVTKAIRKKQIQMMFSTIDKEMVNCAPILLPARNDCLAYASKKC